MKMNSGNYLNYRYDDLQRVTDKYIERDVNVDRQIWERFHYTDSHISKKEVWIGNTYTHQLSYTYDGNGNILTQTDSENGTSVTYTYDKANQLTKAVHGDGRTEVYTYDNAGNILTFNNGSGTHTYAYEDSSWGDLLTKYDGQTITYDGIGNPTSYYNGQRYTFTWEHGRQLASATLLGNTISFEYDSNGLRFKMVFEDGSYIVYDIVEGKAVGETRYNTSGTITLYMRYIFDESGVVNGIGLWYPGDTAWTDYYFAKNLQGDVLAVYDSAHNCVATYSYDSWGNILSQSGPLAELNPFRYRSYYFDQETELYYLQSRYYDPQVGRFLNADALVSTGQGLLGNNMFAYCHNNPVLYVDPSGLIIVLASDATDEQIAEFERAIAYIKTSETGRKLIELLESSLYTITIVFVDNDRMSYDASINTIYFDTNSGLILKDHASTQSAALGLAHEMGHAALDLAGVYNNMYMTREEIEKKVLGEYETLIANELGEPTRNKYSDAIGTMNMQNSTHFRTAVTVPRPWWHYILFWNLFIPSNEAIDHNLID